MTLERIAHTLESGRVLRYHAAPTVPAQPLGQHAWGVTVIALYLAGSDASAALLRACALHDQFELLTGDIPFTVKREVPEMKQLLTEIEAKVAKFFLPMPELTDAEQCILKLADTLEGMIWCRKTESFPGVVQGRWNTSYNTAIEKFRGRVPATVIERAHELAEASLNNICP